MKSVLALGLLAAIAAATASAQSVQITGFGQMVAGSAIDGTRSPTTGERSFPGTGYDSDWDFKDESLFAVQVRGDLNEQWSATAQIVAEGRNDFDPEFAWAYVGWNGGKGLSAKLGRQRIPFFRYSDFLQVGYAYPWLRPPGAVYNLTFSNFDGGSLAYAFGGGSWFSTLSVIGGKNTDEITISGAPADLELQSLVGVTFETSYNDWLTLRAGYFQADVLVDAQALNPLFTTLRSNGFSNVAAAIDINEDPGTFLGFGAEINHGNWLLISEATFVEVDDSYLTDKEQFYVTGGYRFGAWTPTFTYGRREGDAKTGIINLLPNVPPLAALRSAVTGVVLSDNLDADYMSFGLRWDVSNNVALKADYTQYENDGPTASESDAFAAGVVFTF
jgi:hypothetical protein